MAAASLARYARWPTESASVGSAVSTVLCLCLFVCGFSHGNSTADHANAAKLQKDQSIGLFFSTLVTVVKSGRTLTLTTTTSNLAQLAVATFLG